MLLWFLPFRNLRTRLIRTLLTTGGIIIGVGVILAIAITNESTLASVEAVFREASGNAHLVVNSASATDAGFAGASALAKVKQVSGVAQVIPSLDVQTLLAQDADKWQLHFGISSNITAGSNLHIFGIDPQLDPLARNYKIIQGRFLSPKDNRAALLVAEYAREHDLQVGQELRVLTPRGDASFKIVGLIGKEGPGRLNDGATVFVPLDTAQEIFERRDKLTQLDIVVTEKIAQDHNLLEKVRQALEAKLGKHFAVVYPAARGQVVTQLLSTYQSGLDFGSTIALFVGAFLIYNTFAMTVVERTREIGMLRALGMTRGQILMLILQEAALLGVAGSALGLILGLGLARVLIGGMTGVIGNQIGEIVIPPAGIATALAVGLVVTLVAAFVPAWNAAHISPIEALRVRAQADSQSWLVHRGWRLGLGLVVLALLNFYVIPFREEVFFDIGRLSIFVLLIGAALLVPAVVPFLRRALEPLMGALFGSEGALGAANISRARGRAALTVGALMVGISMVIAFGALGASFSQNLLEWVDNAIGADLYVRSPVGMDEDIERHLKAMEGIQAVTPVTYLQVKLGERLREPGKVEQLIYIVIDPASYPRVAHFQFADSSTDAQAALARLAAGDAVFISTTVADKYHLQPGQTIPLVTPRGTREFTIVGLIVDFTGQGYTVTAPRKDLIKYFGVRHVSSYLVRLSPQVKTCGATLYRNHTQQADCRSEADVRHEIETKFRARHLKTESSTAFRARILDLANQAFALMNVLSLIGLIVGALGVINTLMMNVLERTREIGGLRALGLTMRQTAKMILAEALMMGIIGGVFGLGFGYILSQVLLLGVNDLGGYRIAYIFPLPSFVAGVVLALVVSELVALYPAWRAARLGIVQAIQHE